MIGGPKAERFSIFHFYFSFVYWGMQEPVGVENSRRFPFSNFCLISRRARRTCRQSEMANKKQKMENGKSFHLPPTTFRLPPSAYRLSPSTIRVSGKPPSHRRTPTRLRLLDLTPQYKEIYRLNSFPSLARGLAYLRELLDPHICLAARAGSGQLHIQSTAWLRTKSHRSNVMTKDGRSAMKPTLALLVVIALPGVWRCSPWRK